MAWPLCDDIAVTSGHYDSTQKSDFIVQRFTDTSGNDYFRLGVRKTHQEAAFDLEYIASGGGFDVQLEARDDGSAKDSTSPAVFSKLHPYTPGNPIVIKLVVANNNWYEITSSQPTDQWEVSVVKH